MGCLMLITKQSRDVRLLTAHDRCGRNQLSHDQHPGGSWLGPRGGANRPLAGAIVADQRHDLAGLDLEVDMVERGDAPELPNRLTMPSSRSRGAAT